MLKNMKEGYKQTELGVIPEDWEIKKLGDIGSVLTGITYHPDDILDSNNGTLVLRSSNIKDDYLVYDDNVYISNKIKFTPVELNDILICVRNGSRNLIGKSAKIDSKAVGEGFGAFMSVYRSTYNSYIYYYFKSPYFYNEVHRNLGATINSINNNDLKKFKIPLPPIEEQNAIANCLSTWDEAIEKQQKLIEAKEIRHKALMQKLLSGKKRLPGFTDEWKEVKLGDVLDYEQPQNYIVKDTNYNDNYKTPVLTAGKSFILGYTNEEFGIYNKVPVIIFDDFTTSSKYVNFPFKVKSSAMKILKIKGLNNLKFIFSLMQSLEYVVGGHERHWISKFSILNIKLPSIEEQNEIGKFIDLLDYEIEIEKKNFDHLKEQKKALMQKLLTGKVRLPLNN